MIFEISSSFDGRLAIASTSLSVDDLAFDYADLEGEDVRVVLGELRDRFRQIDRIAFAQGDRRHALEMLGGLLKRRPFGGLAGQRVFDDLVFDARLAQLVAQFLVFGTVSLLKPTTIAAVAF